MEKTKFQKGDIVLFDNTQGECFTPQKGKGKVVATHEGFRGVRILVNSDTIENGHDGNGFVESQDNRNNWYFEELELTLVEQDIRDMLQVGYEFDYKYKHMPHAETFTIEDESGLMFVRGVSEALSEAIIEIRKTDNVVWKREETKYYLRSWLNYKGSLVDDLYESNANYLNVGGSEGHLFIFTKDIEYNKTIFTQEEIDKLPNQDFIKTLIKDEVK